VGTAVADVRRGKALAIVMENAKIVDASGNVVDISALDENDAQSQLDQIIEDLAEQADEDDDDFDDDDDLEADEVDEEVEGTEK
jgi:trigger factor